MPLKRIWQRLDQEAGELVRGASLALVIRTAGALITFGLNVLIARRLGVDQTGAFFLALTVATLASVIARAGAPNTVLRFVAANAADNGWNTVRAAYRRGLSICIGVGVAVTAVIVLLAPLLAERVFGQPEIRSALVAMALLIMPTATFRLSSMALQGLGRVADAALSSMALLPGFAIVFLLLLPDTDLLLTIYLYVAATFATAVVADIRFRMAMRGRSTGDGSLTIDGFTRSSLPLLWVEICQNINTWAALFFLGIFGTQADVGLFGAAARVALLLVFALMAINMIVSPRMAAAHQRGDLDGLARTARRGALMSVVMATPMLIVVLLAAKPIMGLFGPEFRAGWPLLSILALGQFVNALTGSVGYALVMTGGERHLRNTLFVTTTLTILLCVTLIPAFGTIGAALTQASVLAIQSLGATWMVWRHLGFLAVPVPGLPVLRQTRG